MNELMGVGELPEPVRRYLTRALPAGAAAPAVDLTMTGRVRAGAWLPFTARETCDGRSFTWDARVAGGALRVVDHFDDGAGSTEGRLLGRLPVLRASGDDVSRSAAGRAALEAIFAPAGLLPERGVEWTAEDAHTIVATWSVPPERPQVRLRIDDRGAVRSVSARRWGSLGRGRFGYLPCGAEIHADRRFGRLVIPSRVTVGWWFGTPRYRPFFRAEIVRAVEMQA